MKGIVFTEFLDMVEEHFSPELADDILDGADLASGGTYTAVGTYDHHEMLALVRLLGSEARVESDDLLRMFGTHLFGRFAEGHRAFFDGIHDTFHFLESVEDYIHVEVLKLYPDAELPQFDCRRPAEGVLHMTYSSGRPLASFAEGLIRGCVTHFGQSIRVTRTDLSGPPGTRARFELVKTEP